MTPSTRSFMMRSMPAFSVSVDAGRAGTAGSDERDRDDPGGLIDVAQHDVAAIGLQRRTDRLDRLLNLCAHALPIEAAGHVRFLPMATPVATERIPHH